MSPSNLQNIHSSGQGLDVKRAFVPKLDAFLFFDYDSIEVRLLAFYLATIGDPSLAEELKHGLDPHLETAKGLFPGVVIDPRTPEGKKMRGAGKQLGFSVQYGGGVPTIMRQLKCSRGEAASLLKAYHIARPGVKILKSAIWERYQEVGYIRTLYDRQLHPDSEHKCLNSLCQGCAADLIRDALQKIHDDLTLPWTASHIVNTVHDEIIIDAAEDEIPELVRRMPTLMGNAEVEKIVPIEVSVEISRINWASKESYVD